MNAKREREAALAAATCFLTGNGEAPPVPPRHTFRASVSSTVDVAEVPTDGHYSGDDFQRRDLVTFEFEKEPNVNRAAWEVAGDMAGDDELSALLLARE